MPLSTIFQLYLGGRKNRTGEVHQEIIGRNGMCKKNNTIRQIHVIYHLYQQNKAVK
jgi:hypothetical protein